MHVSRDAEIDDELIRRDLLNRQFPGFCTFQYPANVSRDPIHYLLHVRRVGHQSTGVVVFLVWEDRGQLCFAYHTRYLGLVRQQGEIAGNDHAVHRPLPKGIERRIDLGQRLLQADVTSLGRSDLGAPYELVLDTGTFHGLRPAEREANTEYIEEVR